MKVITETYYQANDGTAFDRQDDCEKYENYLKLKNQQAQLYDLLWNKINTYSGAGDFILNNYDKIKEIMEGKTEDESNVSTEVNWSKVPAGTVILVRDFNDDEWVEYVFIAYKENDDYPYRCAYSDRGTVHPISWKFAKLKP